MPESNPALFLTSCVISGQQPNLCVSEFLARILEDCVSSPCQQSARHALSTKVQASSAAVLALETLLHLLFTIYMFISFATQEETLVHVFHQGLESAWEL